MLGSLRLILALAVAASHAQWRIAGLNPGVMAVIGFYLISGYVMAGLMRRHYPTLAEAPAFYLDRAARLLPQYFCYALATLAWFTLSRQPTPFLQHAPTLADLLNNALVMPLNYFMYNGSDRFTLIPPAWSLGAEMQFYLVAPFLLLAARRRLAFGVLSLGIYGLALAGWLHSEWYGYRLLPGVLFFFLLGAGLQSLHQRAASAAHGLVAASLAAAGACLWGLHGTGLLEQPYHQETLLGLLLAFPLLHLLAQRVRSHWDDLAGDISYGVFLNHFLVMWTLYPDGVSLNAIPGFLAVCIMLSWLSQRLVERPFLVWRKALRKSGQAKP